MQRIQTSLVTYPFREADVLRAAKSMLNSARPRILSFGCSIGDELATLRVMFPEAEIFGCDIDELAISTASRTVGHLAEVFRSSREEVAARGPFDLICAFSSLCINPLPKLEVFKKSFPFSLFNDMVSMLDEQVVPGGLLAIKNSSYAFPSADAAANYNRVRIDGVIESGFIPIFNKNGELALSVVRTAVAHIFQVEDVAGMTDWDFIDSLFQKRAGIGEQMVVQVQMPQRLPDDAVKAPIQWIRSNLDAWTGEPSSRLLEVRQVYQCLTSVSSGPHVTKFTERQFLNGGFRPMGFGGGWPDFIL